MLQKYALFFNKTAYLHVFFLFYAIKIIFIIINNISADGLFMDFMFLITIVPIDS